MHVSATVFESTLGSLSVFCLSRGDVTSGGRAANFFQVKLDTVNVPQLGSHNCEHTREGSSALWFAVPFLLFRSGLWWRPCFSSCTLGS